MTEPSKPLVLLVDDTPANINLLVTLLEASYDLAIAGNGTEALAMVQETPPDLILLDVMMPDIDGYEVCRRLKEDVATHRIPVIFLTARTDTEDIVRGFDVGGVDYVAKPFRPAELEARVRTHIQLQQLKSLLFMCSYCNKIRNGDAWESVPTFLKRNTGTDVSHGVCPTCFERTMRELRAANAGTKK